jgi:hypothetical protein
MLIDESNGQILTQNSAAGSSSSICTETSDSACTAQPPITSLLQLSARQRLSNKSLSQQFVDGVLESANDKLANSSYRADHRYMLYWDLMVNQLTIEWNQLDAAYGFLVGIGLELAAASFAVLAPDSSNAILLQIALALQIANNELQAIGFLAFGIEGILQTIAAEIVLDRLISDPSPAAAPANVIPSVTEPVFLQLILGRWRQKNHLQLAPLLNSSFINSIEIKPERIITEEVKWNGAKQQFLHSNKGYFGLLFIQGSSNSFNQLTNGSITLYSEARQQLFFNATHNAGYELFYPATNQTFVQDKDEPIAAFASVCPSPFAVGIDKVSSPQLTNLTQHLIFIGVELIKQTNRSDLLQQAKQLIQLWNI